MTARSWAERHAQTLVGSLGRLARQPLSTLMTMAVIAVALALPLLLDVFLLNLRSATVTWNQGIDISVYMDKKAAAARTQAVVKQLRDRDDVATVRVITADEALAQFRSASGFGGALDALDDNPLPDTLIVTPTAAAGSPSAMGTLEAGIAAMAGVQAVQVDTRWVTRLYGILDMLRSVVWLTGALLGLGVVLVIGNTIRLDILNRRAEIEVMKLVGATDGFTRRPFLYSGIWYGLGGGGVALILSSLAVAILAAPAARLAGLYGSVYRLHGLGFARGTAVLGLGIALGWLGSWLAATRHIRAIDPT